MSSWTHPHVEDRVWNALKSDEDNPMSNGDHEAIAMVIAEAVQGHCIKRGAELGHKCDVRVELLADWRKAAKDPDGQPERWLRSGGPLGITAHPADRKVFPVSARPGDAEFPLTIYSRKPLTLETASSHTLSLTMMRTHGRSY